ncbi:hypothetical protein TWF225_003351 [Orbilia oligospora]|uniref:Uncharacterized protein n=1 Tax=Orbilia oligospora TaxID=2813651 RepID=A0A7C8K6U6_ORBOL|nr:hypothetical protein TWF751_001204 [Orbilia oligospora]KAF3188365.1 hypothetical protein TWF225_003351 [Orbilia oligospora]KAF3240282.1 hypothetical protein TWF217_000867 [Orbilia oligospora]KAF3258516.1 hypothetical protein TWF128_004747 [Orbilia oligospora]KAF3281336.1 hypothetical protein TWF132_011330 [Orbilia oligospora]
MATTGPARSSAAEQLRQGLEIDVGGLDNINSRFTSALISHSHDACLSDININSNSRKDPTSASISNTSSGSGGGGGHINVSSSSDSFADLNESLASTSTSDIKSPTSKPSNNRSLPGSPYSMTDSFAPSSAGLPSSSAASYSNIRLTPYSTSSFLRPGSRFEGTQQSDKQTYTVHVEIKHVDMRESFLCGYLCIQGLTQDNPTLTTYFEGELIGSKYAFKTKNKNWGASEKIDLQHWGRFPAYRPYTKSSKSKESHTKDFGEQEHIFMRWKEYFLVPNHRVKELTGASFDGFYYICFSQVTGDVSGIYFHSNSEKWQQLELKHVPDHGIYGSIEFR